MEKKFILLRGSSFPLDSTAFLICSSKDIFFAAFPFAMMSLVRTTVLSIMLLFCGASANLKEVLRHVNNSMLDFNQQSHLNSSDVTLGGPSWRKKKQRGNKMFSIPLRHAEGSSSGMVGGIHVGDPYLGVEVMFDTQTCDILMFHPEITENAKGSFKEKNKFYDPEKSNPRNIEYAFERTYPDGSEYGGGTVDDRILVGPAALNSVTFAWVDNMNEAAADVKGSDLDGIVGLGPSPSGFKLNTKKNGEGMTAIFDELANLKTDPTKPDSEGDYLEAPVFAFYVSKSGKTGEVTFGGHNKKLVAGDMSYFPALSLSPGGYAQQTHQWDNQRIIDGTGGALAEEGDSGGAPASLQATADGGGGANLSLRGNFPTRPEEQEAPPSRSSSSTMTPESQEQQSSQDVVWGVEVYSMSIGGQDFFTGDRQVYGLFSSTSPYGMTLPRFWLVVLSDMLRSKGAKLSDAGELSIDCEKLHELPDLTLTIFGVREQRDEHTLSFTPLEYFPNVVDSGNSKKKKKKNKDMKDRTCTSFFGVIPAKEFNEKSAIQFGIPFMKKYYVEYDYGAAVKGPHKEIPGDHGDSGKKLVTSTRMPPTIGIALSKGVEVKYKTTKKKKGTLSRIGNKLKKKLSRNKK